MEYFPETITIQNNLNLFSAEINQICFFFGGSSLEEVVNKLMHLDPQQLSQLLQSLENTNTEILKNQITAEILRLCNAIKTNRDINEYKSDIVTIFFAGLIEGIKTRVNSGDSHARVFYDAIIHFWKSVVYFILCFIEVETKWIFDAMGNMDSPIKKVLTAIYELISPLEEALGVDLQIVDRENLINVYELLNVIINARELLTKSQ